MKPQKRLELTEQEFEELVNELSERIKDVIYMNLKGRLRNEVKKIFKAELETNSSIELTWALHLVFGDIEQIVGRLRRKEAKP